MRRAIGWAAVALLAAGGLAAVGPARAAELAPGLAKVGHILVIFEENRSFDNMFGLFPGADGIANAVYAPKQVDREGRVYDKLPHPLDSNLKPKGPDPRIPADLPNAPFLLSQYISLEAKSGNLIHEFYREQMQIDGGRMDRFVAYTDSAGLVMGYYDTRGTNAWKLAQEYTLGDRMFHGAFGGSFLNHTWLVCSCALRFPNAPAKLVSAVDANGRMIRDGQVTPDGYAVNTLRSVYLHKPSDTDPSVLVPPQTLPHIGDRLDAAGVSWKWYSGGYDNAMAGKPDKLFQYHHQPLAYFKDLAPGTAAQKAHLQDEKNLLSDIDEGRLPQVAFYKPLGQLNQHPGYANIEDGDVHLGEIVARLTKSPQWKDTLVIVTYDENGGEYDHVAPPIRDHWGPGTRIPLIAIGEMVKRGFIDHTVYDFGSILRTIELRFGAEPVNQVDGAATPMVNLLQ